jgi:hypothetical protein
MNEILYNLRFGDIIIHKKTLCNKNSILPWININIQFI